jgi:hypothetical protein
MIELTAGWKLFRVVCIIQMIVVSLELILSVGGLFSQKVFFYSVFSTLIYFVILVFLYQGLSLINYNYPDILYHRARRKVLTGFFFSFFTDRIFIRADSK